MVIGRVALLLILAFSQSIDLNDEVARINNQCSSNVYEFAKSTINADRRLPVAGNHMQVNDREECEMMCCTLFDCGGFILSVFEDSVHCTVFGCTDFETCIDGRQMSDDNTVLVIYGDRVPETPLNLNDVKQMINNQNETTPDPTTDENTITEDDLSTTSMNETSVTETPVFDRSTSNGATVTPTPIVDAAASEESITGPSSTMNDSTSSLTTNLSMAEEVSNEYEQATETATPSLEETIPYEGTKASEDVYASQVPDDGEESMMPSESEDDYFWQQYDQSHSGFKVLLILACVSSVFCCCFLFLFASAVTSRKRRKEEYQKLSGSNYEVTRSPK